MDLLLLGDLKTVGLQSVKSHGAEVEGLFANLVKRKTMMFESNREFDMLLSS